MMKMGTLTKGNGLTGHGCQSENAIKNEGEGLNDQRPEMKVEVRLINAAKPLLSKGTALGSVDALKKGNP